MCCNTHLELVRIPDSQDDSCLNLIPLCKLKETCPAITTTTDRGDLGRLHYHLLNVTGVDKTSQCLIGMPSSMAFAISK